MIQKYSPPETVPPGRITAAVMPPPIADPPKPIKTVNQKGIGSGPGIARRASAPIRKPAATTERMAPST